MSQYTHKCVKCSIPYTDIDPDAYYCIPCNEERLRIAAEVDAKLATQPKKEVTSDFQIAQKLGKTIASANKYGGEATFVKAGDLGIDLKS